MLLVAHDGAARALRVVVLVLGKTVVDKKCCPSRELVGQRANERLALGVNFGQVVVRTFGLHWRTQARHAVLPHQRWRRALTRFASILRLSQHHATLMPNALESVQQFDRHGVEHLVAHHHALHLVWQGLHPVHQVAKLLQRVLLARAQAARQIYDGVARERHALRQQAVQQLQGQRARAGAKLPDLVRLRLLQSLRHLGGQGLAKQGRDLGGGDKVAAAYLLAVLRGVGQGPKFKAVVGVITQPRRVQSHGHEGVKADPATLLANLIRDNLVQTDRNIFGGQIGHKKYAQTIRTSSGGTRPGPDAAPTNPDYVAESALHRPRGRTCLRSKVCW